MTQLCCDKKWKREIIRNYAVHLLKTIVRNLRIAN